MVMVTASVGRGCVNRLSDVRHVQDMLNRCVSKLAPMGPVTVSGQCDSKTVLLIEEFQRRVVRTPMPDGRVDPGGRTLALLIGAPTTGVEPVLSGTPLPVAAAKVLRETLASAGVASARVSSVSRAPAQQARIMYDSCVAKGAAFNKRMYAKAGDKVVDVYTANKDEPREAVIKLMLAKIAEVGPEQMSRHVSETHYTFDVVTTSIPVDKQPAFLKAIKAHPAVSNVIAPPSDPAFHIEIAKNSPSL